MYHLCVSCRLIKGGGLGPEEARAANVFVFFKSGCLHPAFLTPSGSLLTQADQG